MKDEKVEPVEPEETKEVSEIDAGLETIKEQTEEQEIQELFMKLGFSIDRILEIQALNQRTSEMEYLNVWFTRDNGYYKFGDTPAYGELTVVTPGVYKMITYLIRAGHTPMIKIATNELNFTVDDITYEEKELILSDYIDATKGYFRTTAFQLIEPYASIDMFELTIAYGKLADKGYFIDNDNREEKYIEILEADDDELLNKLEDYLIKLDASERNLAFYSMYKKTLEEVESARSNEEVTELKNRLIEITSKD